MRSVVLLLVTVVAGCASQSLPVPTSEGAAAVSEAEQQVARDETELNLQTAGARPPDCTRARVLRDNICALARRICLLVERDAAIPDGPVRCQKARARCQKARDRITASCDKG